MNLLSKWFANARPQDKVRGLAHPRAAPRQQLLGEKSDAYDWTAHTADRLLHDVQAGMLVTIGSKAQQPKGSPVVDNRAYFVTGYNARTGTFTVVNPWGWKNPGRFAGMLHLTPAEVERYFDALETPVS